MFSLNAIKRKISNTYKKVDKALGGWLPGGVSPGSSKNTSRSNSKTINKQKQGKQNDFQNKVQGLVSAVYSKRPIKPIESAGNKYPTYKVTSEIINTKERLKAAGINPNVQVHKPSTIERVLDVLDRPGAAVRAFISTSQHGGNLRQSLQSAKEGFMGKKKVSELDLLETAARGGNPLAQKLISTPVGKILGSIFVGIASDPTSYSSIGKTAAKTGIKAVTKADDVKTLAKNISKEILNETGKKISQETAERLAKNAIKGNIPVGRMGAAITRAMGGLAESKGVESPIAQLAKVEQKINKVKKISDKSDTVKTITRYDIELPLKQKPETYLKIAGIPVVNVTPVVTKMGAVIERVPGVTRVKDALGRTFVFNYTPTGIQGIERAKVTKAKEIVTEGFKKAPAVAERTLNKTLKSLKDIPKDVAEKIPYIIEKTAPDTPEYRQYVNRITNMLDKDAKLMIKNKLPLDVIDNYIPHLYEDPPEKVKDVISKWRNSALRVSGATPSFMKTRLIPTLEVAEKLGLHPVKDARVLTGVHRAMTEQALVFNKMAKDLAKIGVISSKPLEGWSKISDIPILEGKYVHPEVAKTIKNLYPVLTNRDEGVKLLEQLHNSALNAWKSIALATPSFHLRNFLGNIWLNMADGMFNPSRYTQAAALLFNKLDNVELAGRKVPANVVLKWFEDYGLKGQGMFHEVARERKLTEEAKKALDILERSGFGKVMYFVKHPFESSRRLGENVDTLSRLANFLHHLDQGFDPRTAAQLTRNALFDYSELTPAEKTIRKYLMPFYTWKRKAIPKMVEKLIGVPGIFTGTAHVRNAFVNVNDIDEEYLPDWLRENQAIPLWVDAKGNIYYLTANLPLTELSTIHDPLEIQKWNKEIISMLNPLFTIPVQIAQNRSLLTESEITQTPDLPYAALKDYAKFLLSQFGMARELASQMTANEQQLRQQATGEGEEVTRPPHLLAGIPISAQNPSVWARSDLYTERNILRQMVEDAQRRGIHIPTTEELQQQNITFEDKVQGLVNAVNKKSNSPSTYIVPASTFEDKVQGLINAVNSNRIMPRINVGNAPTVINEAAKITGIDQSWIPWLVYLMQRESGGNPAAYNPTPVNGEHATGLFQMLPSTFRRYALPGHTDIWNPLDNTIAAIRYIKARYGHPSRIPGLTSRNYRGY